MPMAQTMNSSSLKASSILIFQVSLSPLCWIQTPRQHDVVSHKTTPQGYTRPYKVNPSIHGDRFDLVCAGHSITRQLTPLLADRLLH